MSTMHEIQVLHRLQEIERIESSGDSWITVEECQDCGQRSQCLHLRVDPRPSSHDSPQEELSATIARSIEIADRMLKACNGMVNDILEGTTYQDIDALVSDIDKRYEGQVNAMEMPLGELKEWVDTQKRKLKRKVLLAYKQGLVCNRCDQVCSWEDMTLDEINPRDGGGQAKLWNSQLLCQNCNHDKDNHPPDERDISAFVYSEPPCIHRITCFGETKHYD